MTAAVATATNNYNAKIIDFSERDKSFILFPLSALKTFITDADGLNIILEYGIKRLGDSIPADSITDEEMIEESISEFRKGEYNGNLTGHLYDMLFDFYNKYGNLDIALNDNCRNTFLQWYRIRLALKKLNLKGSIQVTIDKARRIIEKPGEPLIMASVDFILKANKIKPNEKQRMAIALLFGLNSIIGMRRTWAATTQEMIKARMFGYLTPKREGKSYENKETKDLWKKWTTRRRYESLIVWLQEMNLLKCYMGTTYRRTVVSVQSDWDTIKDDVTAFIIRHRKPSLQAKKQRDELSQMLNEQLK